jgi:hypothetical protein
MDLFESALDVLSITPALRSAFHTQMLVKATRSIKFFQHLNSPKLHEKCCRQLTLQTFLPSQVVVKIGGIGDAFFIVLKGQLSVLLLYKTRGEE